MKFVDRTGEENYNNFGALMKIAEYTCCDDIWVEFQDKYKEKVHTTYQNFKKGNVKNPYDKTVYEVGYLGEGKYKSKKDGKLTNAYKTWVSMIQRCYDPYELNKYPTYIDCYVCKEWHCFQNFAKWWEENVYNCDNERLHLDKDILFKGNKIYSPETCILVPERINVLFVKCNKARGKYPIGVSEDINKKYGYKKLYSSCSVLENGKRKKKNLGRFPLNRPFQAFYTYKIFKENYIKQVAEEYRGLIPNKLYNALCSYKVEIND